MPDATPMEKLMLLRKYLKDEPKKLVDSLGLTDAAYQVALDLLESNYSQRHEKPSESLKA